MAVIENKVQAATAGAGASVIVANFVLWILSYYYSSDVAEAAPVVGFVNLIAAAGGAFVLGFFARHTPRAELEQGADDGRPADGDLDPPGNAL